jgi:curved DNA-binding protein CbpA
MTQSHRAGGPDLYTILGIGPDATAGQVTRAFRARVRQLHPDTSHDTETAGSADLDALLTAWHVLHDPARRAAYDRTRTPTRPNPPAPPPPPAAGGRIGSALTADRPVPGAPGSGAVLRIGPPVWLEYRQHSADP